MSTIPNHLYEDGNTTGYGRKQTKSILKNRENMTMPNPSMPQRHFDTASRLANRRVSFANKVKLHKIDFVPMNGASSESEMMEEKPDSSSDEEEEEGDVSLSALEKDASAFMDQMRSIQNDNNSSDDDDLPQNENVTERSNDDQIMDFTGSIRHTQEQDMDFTDQLNSHQKMTLAYPLSTDNHNSHEHLHQNYQNHNSNLEITMELTKNVSSYAMISNTHPERFGIESPKPHFLNGHRLEFDGNGNEEATMDFTKFFNDSSRHEIFNLHEAARLSPIPLPGLNMPSASQDGDDMELTQQFHKANVDEHDKHQQTNGDLQQNKVEFKAPSTPPILHSPSVRSDDGHSVNGEEADHEQTMEFTGQIRAVNSGQTDNENEQNGAESNVEEPEVQDDQANLEQPASEVQQLSSPEAETDNNQGEHDGEEENEQEPEKSPSEYGTPAASPTKTPALPEDGSNGVSAAEKLGGSEVPLGVPQEEASEPHQAQANISSIPVSSNEVQEGEEANLEANVSEAKDTEEPIDEDVEEQEKDTSLNEEDGQQHGLKTPEAEEDVQEKRPGLPDGNDAKTPDAAVEEENVQGLSQEAATASNPIESSQPMELTQSRSEIQNVSKIESPLKRSSDGFDESVSKQQRSETHVSTLDIPLAETSTLSVDGVDEDYDDPNYEPVSLPTFLNDIGVKFYDDLEIATDTANRYSLALHDDATTVSDEEYYKANVHLPLLEVLEMSCKELTQKIQQGKTLFQEVSQQTLDDNPVLFKQYYSSSYYDQISMKSHFHQLKEFTRHQAKQVWYQWRTQLMQNVLEVQQGNLEILQADKAILSDSIEELEATQANIRAELQQLKNDISSFKEIKASFQDLDANQLKNIKSQLMELNQKLLDHRDDITKKEEKLSKVEEKIKAVNADIQKQQDELRKAESQLSRRRHFSNKEIEELENDVEETERRAALKYVSGIGTDDIEFECNSNVAAVITYQDSVPSSIRFKERETNASDLIFKSLAPLALKELPKEGLSPEKNITEFKSIWQKVKEIDMDLYKLSLKYPLQLNVNEDKFRVEITVFTFGSGTETIFELELQARDIMSYPNQLAVTAKKGRRSVSTDLKPPALKGVSKELMAKFQAQIYD
ncbi:hypothetical protein FT663_02772 [Candidozyma haemuli var. vulneris]|nr:hypothetical protein FT662_02861 [[Candida] haemuloni var. vulneris]KAF3991365.1 hypothetical protein FT663_02772 [[Candida] haemuloni var. vulneris]